MSLNPKALFFLSAVVVSSVAVRAQNRLYFEDHTFDIGSTANHVSLLADIDQPAYAVSVHFEFNPDRLGISGVDLGAATAAAGPDFADGSINNSSGDFSYGLLFDLTEPITKTLPPGNGLEILDIAFEVIASTPTSADLDLRNDFGPPARVNTVADSNGDRLAPTLEDGKITIVQPVQTRFSLDFDGPSIIRGIAGGVGYADYFCDLTHEGEGVGAEGWSFGIRTSGATITEITDEDTLSAALSDGGLRDDGFIRMDLAIGDDSGGATCAVILCFGCGATIPPDSTGRVAKIRVQVPVPAAGSGTAALEIADDVQGPGQPVETVITQANTTFVPVFGRQDIDVVAGDDGGLIRADSNNDGEVNISDGVHLLNHLFAGGPAAVCLESADMNDDGSRDISDPVYLFNHLFSGGPAVPQPYPDCGIDPGGAVCPQNSCNT